MRIGLISACLLAFALSLAAENALAEHPSTQDPLDIGSRLELFVDDFLIESMNGLELALQQPRPAGKVMTFDCPWEGITTSEITIFKDGDRYRMYYGGDNASKSVTRSLLRPGEVLTPQHRPAICHAESRDGIQWTRPSLGIYEFGGSKDNNITWMDLREQPGKDMFVFRDDNSSARHCQVNVGWPIPSRNTPQLSSSSADTRRLPPVGKSYVAKQPLMNCLEMVPTHSEQILNRTVYKEESLSLLD